jgi:hypothetical protein
VQKYAQNSPSKICSVSRALYAQNKKRENTMNMNNNPTIDEIREITKNCNDEAAHHAMWISNNGDVFIDPIPQDLNPIGFEESKPDLKIRYETSVAGNDYVGPKAARDNEYMERIFKSLVKEWEEVKDIPGKQYIDLF